MKFYSTRGKDTVNSAAEAIVKGLSSDGGLFVPETFPDFSDKLENMLSMEYYERANYILSAFMPEYGDELKVKCKAAYDKFENSEPAPVVKVDDNFYITELFHGPTLAFKDVALTLLPFLLKKGSTVCGIKEDILVLVATSGDTGKAALEGFKNADGNKIMVFYPTGGVSDMQKLQMSTQEGENVNVVSVVGNFDDCQSTVKKIFSDEKFAEDLKKKGYRLSSANSINFGRLAPQITYYFSSYCDLVSSGEISMGDKVDFVVPTGNFGNILAGYYAKKMGLPIDKLVCASNRNNVLTEFFASGKYDKNREFYKTTSPSMDILISSNLERLVFEVSDRNCDLTAKRMEELKNTGVYEVSKTELNKMAETFYADFADEEECKETIAEVFDENGYLMDPHTAVAVSVYKKYKSYTGSNKPVVVLSTASPYKFGQAVSEALFGKKIKDAFIAAEKISEQSAVPIPENILSLKNKPIRFNKSIDKADAEDEVLNFINK